MRKLDVSAISNTNAMPVKAGIWEHLQLAYQEGLAEIVKSLFGKPYDATKVYILNGVINTGSGSDYNISAGSIFYNGEIFLVDASTFTITGSDVARAIITTTYFTDGVKADGVDFTDGVTRNIHQIRKITISAGLSGSGVGDFADMINYAYKPQGGIGQTIEWTIPGGSVTTYFDATSKQGVHPLTLGWIIDDEGYTIFGYKAGDTDFGTIGVGAGAKTVTLTADNIPTLETDPDFATSSGTGVTAYAKTDSGTKGPEPVNHNPSPTAFKIIPPFKVKLKITRYY